MAERDIATKPIADEPAVKAAVAEGRAIQKRIDDGALGGSPGAGPVQVGHSG